jgi:hypothetical protein
MPLGDNIIRVISDPNAAASTTSSNEPISNTSSESLKDKNDDSAGLVDLALLGGSALNLATATAGQAEAITGDALVQKSINAVAGGVGLLGILFAVTKTAKTVGTQLLVARNDNLKSTYNTDVKGNAYNNGRIVGGN